MDAICIKCPNCDMAQESSNKRCPACRQPIVIPSFNSVKAMPLPQINKYVKSYEQTLLESPDNAEIYFSKGLCFLRLKIYDKALQSFEKAFEKDYSYADAYFYAAVCLLEGKKAFLSTAPIITKAIQYIDAASSLGGKAAYSYFIAYLKYDYYSRKFLSVSPDYRQELVKAQEAGLTEQDRAELFEILGVEMPEQLA